MDIEQHKLNREHFFVRFTLDEYELLRKCCGPNEINYEKVLKEIIDAGIHKKKT